MLPLPLSGDSMRTTFEIEGKQIAKSDLPSTHIRAVGLNYFQTMQIPFLAGREFNARDDRHAPHVVVINQTLARRFFPNESPSGSASSRGMSSGKTETHVRDRRSRKRRQA